MSLDVTTAATALAGLKFLYNLMYGKVTRILVERCYRLEIDQWTSLKLKFNPKEEKKKYQEQQDNNTAYGTYM